MPTVTTRTIPYRGWQTWVRVTEPDVPVPGALPLVVLHGGPGLAHDYVRNIEGLADTGRTVIHYDQIGCGRSTHLPDAPADLWAPALFVDEFTNLVDQLGLLDYHLLGQSWGGMLAAEIAIQQPAGLRSLAICNSPASMQLWLQGAAELRAELPPDVRGVLTSSEADGTTTTGDYLRAADIFYERHVCRVSPIPQDFQDSTAQMEIDPTVYHTMNGPNEFFVIGTLRNWTIIDRLGTIIAPTVVVAGEYDEATAETWQPFVDRIPVVTSHVFPGASHCVHLEQPEAFRAFIGDFLASHDG